jgi:hypothetical protein
VDATTRRGRFRRALARHNANARHAAGDRHAYEYRYGYSVADHDGSAVKHPNPHGHGYADAHFDPDEHAERDRDNNANDTAVGHVDQHVDRHVHGIIHCDAVGDEFAIADSYTDADLYIDAYANEHDGPRDINADLDRHLDSDAHVYANANTYRDGNAYAVEDCDGNQHTHAGYLGTRVRRRVRRRDRHLARRDGGARTPWAQALRPSLRPRRGREGDGPRPCDLSPAARYPLQSIAVRWRDEWGGAVRDNRGCHRFEFA